MRSTSQKESGLNVTDVENLPPDIPHGGRDFGEFFSGKTTHIAFPGAVTDAGVRRSDSLSGRNGENIAHVPYLFHSYRKATTRSLVPTGFLWAATSMPMDTKSHRCGCGSQTQAYRVCSAKLLANIHMRSFSWTCGQSDFVKELHPDHASSERLRSRRRPAR